MSTTWTPVIPRLPVSASDLQTRAPWHARVCRRCGWMGSVEGAVQDQYCPECAVAGIISRVSVPAVEWLG